MGNLWDRMTRPPGAWRGEVVDWIQLPNWPIFNIADSAIVCAGILMTYLAMRNIQPSNNRESDAS
jgi:signal peptidase II